MMLPKISRRSLLRTSLAVPLGGCPSKSTCEDYSPPASFDAKTPTVSFAKDVTPIFANSCAFTSCHGSTSGSSNASDRQKTPPFVEK